MSKSFGRLAGPALAAALVGSGCQSDTNFSIMVTTGVQVNEGSGELDNSVEVDVVPVKVEDGELSTIFKENKDEVVGVDTEVWETANGVRTAVIVSGLSNGSFEGRDSLNFVLPIDPNNMFETRDGKFLVTVASSDFSTGTGVRCELTQVREVRQDEETPREAGEAAPAGVARRFSLGSSLPEVDSMEVADMDVTGLNELFRLEDGESVFDDRSNFGIGGSEFLSNGGPFMALQCVESGSGAAELRLRNFDGDDDDSSDGGDDDDSSP